MESKFTEWWGNTRDKILHIAREESNNGRVQAILELAGQESANGMYI